MPSGSSHLMRGQTSKRAFTKEKEIWGELRIERRRLYRGIKNPKGQPVSKFVCASYCKLPQLCGLLSLLSQFYNLSVLEIRSPKLSLGARGRAAFLLEALAENPLPCSVSRGHLLCWLEAPFQQLHHIYLCFHGHISF